MPDRENRVLAPPMQRPGLPKPRYTGPIGHGQRRAWLNAQAGNVPGPGGIGQEKVIPGAGPRRAVPPPQAPPPGPMQRSPMPLRPSPQQLPPPPTGGGMQAMVPTQMGTALPGVNPNAQAVQEGQRRAMRRPFAR